MKRLTLCLWCCFLICMAAHTPSYADDAIVESEELIQQLQKKPLTRKTRGFVVTGKDSDNVPQQVAQPSATIYVYFISGTVKFADAQSQQQLDELGLALTSKSLAGAQFEISGHTDSVGSEAYNMDLSKRRAATVNAYLEQNFGYSTSSVAGYGETRPVASNDTKEGRAKNRRVVITRLD